MQYLGDSRTKHLYSQRKWEAMEVYITKIINKTERSIEVALLRGIIDMK
jgi:hypothetical protein